MERTAGLMNRDEAEPADSTVGRRQKKTSRRGMTAPGGFIAWAWQALTACRTNRVMACEQGMPQSPHRQFKLRCGAVFISAHAEDFNRDSMWMIEFAMSSIGTRLAMACSRIVW